MAAVRPFLLRVQEQAKRFADLVEVTNTLSATDLLEDVRTAHALAYEDFSKAITPEARFWRCYWDAPDLVEDQRFLRLPATFRKFFTFKRWDDNRKVVLASRIHVPGTDSRNGIILLPHVRKLEFSPLVFPAEVGTWELTYETGPIELHYGNPTANQTTTAATYTDSTKLLSKTGAFSAYAFKLGDTVKISAGAGVTPGTYSVVARVDDDGITIADAGADSSGDVDFKLWKIDRVNLDTTPTLGEYISSPEYYTGATLYVVSGTGIDQYAQVTSFAVAAGEAVLLDDLETALDDTSVYEIRPWVPGPAGVFDEIISWHMALKYRRTRSDDPESEKEAVRQIKTIFSGALKAVGDVNTDSGISFRTKARQRNRRVWQGY